MQSTSNLGRLPALQYDFGANWNTEVRSVLNRPEVAEEFQRRLRNLLDGFEELYENGDLGEGESARKYYLSLVLGAEARYQDLHWLRSEFESYDLACLSLVIAQAIRPGEEWDIVEGRETEHCVVTNPLRTLVFDMKHYDRLSGAESLVYAGDIEAIDGSPHPEGAMEILRERLAQAKHALRKAKELVDSKEP
jgi:hypothetical protein